MRRVDVGIDLCGHGDGPLVIVVRNAGVPLGHIDFADLFETHEVSTGSADLDVQ